MSKRKKFNGRTIGKKKFHGPLMGVTRKPAIYTTTSQGIARGRLLRP